MSFDYRDFTETLETWAQKNSRKFPWREDFEPYQIWISEIMLQQTQASRVANSFFPRFIRSFPDIWTLATSSWEEVYECWRGLGYYSRAKNILKTAKIIVKNFQGIFPKTAEELCQLPGIGPYTAHAILAFAYDIKVPAMDTNLKKVFTLLNPKISPEKSAEKAIAFAQSSRVWNGAIMDLAQALREKNINDKKIREFFPHNVYDIMQKSRSKISVKKVTSKDNLPVIRVGVACIYEGRNYLIQRHQAGEIGEWEFAGGKQEKTETLRACVKREVMEELGVEVSVRPYFYDRLQLSVDKKRYYHLFFHRCQIQKGKAESCEGQAIEWVDIDDLAEMDFLPADFEAISKLQNFPYVS